MSVSLLSVDLNLFTPSPTAFDVPTTPPRMQRLRSAVNFDFGRLYCDMISMITSDDAKCKGVTY